MSVLAKMGRGEGLRQTIGKGHEPRSFRTFIPFEYCDSRPESKALKGFYKQRKISIQLNRGVFH